MTAAEATSRMAAALAEVQANLPVIHKANSADTGKYTYKYADLAEIAGAVYPLLSKAGLAWTALPTLEDSGFVLRYELMHTSGESRTGAYPLPNPANTQAQAVGSAITYARRYTLCAVVGVAPDEDDDGQAAARERRRKQEMADNARARLRAACEEHGWDLGDIASQYAATHRLALREEDDAGAIEKFRAGLLNEWTSKPATAHERATGRPEQPGAPRDAVQEQQQAREPAAAAPAVADEPGADVGEEPDWDALIAEVERTGNVTPAWKLAREHRPYDMELRERIQKAGQSRRTAPAEQAAADEPPAEEPLVDQKQQRHMHALLRKADVVDRDERLAVTSRIVGRHLDTSKDLTYAEADQVIQRLQAFDVAGGDALKEAVDRWLGEYHAAHTPPADDAAEGES